MKARWLWLSLALGLVFAVGSFGGCSAGNRHSLSSNGANGTGTGTTATGMGGNCLLCGQGGGGGNVNNGMIVVTPQGVSLTVSGGMIPTQQFKATFNGSDVTSSVTWVVEKPDVGSITSAGLFSPTGNVGGITKVIALYNVNGNTLQGSSDVTVTVSVLVSNGVSSGQQGQLNAAQSADPSVDIIYPYNKVVFPLRVLSPEFQWNGGNPGDVYRLRLQSKYITHDEYFTADPPSRHTLDQKKWENLEFSGTGPDSDPVTVTLSRLSGGQAYKAKTIQLRIAQGIIYGSIYYWQLPKSCNNGFGNGHVLRIKPGSTMTDEFFPENQCYGCHSVSRDGKTMMASFGPPTMQTIDLTQMPAVLGTIQQGQGISGVFSEFNDKSTKIAYSNDGGGVGAGQAVINIIDAKTGQHVLDNALPPGCGEPAWSPDGTMLAGVCGMQGFGWTFDSPSGDLTIAFLNKAQTQVMSTKAIVQQGVVGQGRPAYPSFSPDSKYLAFGAPTAGSRSTGPGNLWFTDVKGNKPVQLASAAPDGHSYNPKFAPISAGGFTWVVFISQRDYGNELVGANTNQLWMTAIDDPPTPGQDPSHPAFYIRGQYSCDYSENAYYALDPCKPDGSDCEHGIECCNKSCIYDDGKMKHICEPAMGGKCIPTNSGTCAQDSDCCDVALGIICIDGFCEPKPLK